MSKTNKEKEDLRIIRTKSLLVKALFELLAIKNLDKISVLDICDTAMIHRTTFYKHFIDKYDLLTFAIKRWQEKILPESLAELNISSVKLFCVYLLKTVIDNVYENKNILLEILKNNQYTVMPRLMISTLNERLSFIINKKGIDKTKVPLDVIMMFFSGGFSSLILWWLSNSEKITKDEFLSYINTIITCSVILPD